MIKLITSKRKKKENFYFLDKLENLNKEIYDNISLAVISTWGPSHYKFFNFLNKKKIKHFLIEKPLCASEDEADLILKKQKKIIPILYFIIDGILMEQKKK